MPHTSSCTNNLFEDQKIGIFFLKSFFLIEMQAKLFEVEACIALVLIKYD